MKKSVFSFLFLALVLSLYAQDGSNKLSYKFYGFVRGDFVFDTRQSVAANEGLFFLYPKDESLDANGKDLNEVASSGFYTFNTRAGIDVSGLQVFDANVSLKAEADFAGFSGSYGANSTVFRIRQAYIKMDWDKSSLLLGQTWHPMFQVIPNVISLSTGAPFNPFNRSPQIRFDYKADKLTLTGAAIYQLQYTSSGPEGKTNTYQRNAIIPELYAGVDYKINTFNVGAGIDYLTIKPRTTSSVIYSDPSNPNFRETLFYKVDESLSSLSYSAYVKYSKDLFSITAKTIYGQNNSNLCMLGGYGVKQIDTNTGEQEYTNYTHSSTWLNLSYGKKYMGNLFAGYTKNLGTKDALVSMKTYGEGLDIDNLYRFCGTFSYNVSKFSVGLEYEMTSAAYGNSGTFNENDGRYDKTHSVLNHRLIGVICYNF